MEFKGTKGKLQVNNYTFQNEGKGNVGSFDIVNEYGEKFGQVYPYEFFGLTLKQAEANALLISKAPEMLEMIIEFINEFDLHGDENEVIINKAKKIVKEATDL